MKCTETFGVRYARPEQPAVAHTTLDCINMTVELRVQSLKRDKSIRFSLSPSEARTLAVELLYLANEAQSRGYTD